MATASVRYKSGSSTDGVALNITYDETAKLDNTYGHIAIVKSITTTGVSTVPTTTSDYTRVLDIASTNGTSETRLTIFAARGNGNINGIWIAGVAGVSRAAGIQTFSGIDRATFWTVGGTATTTSTVTTLSATMPAVRADGYMVMAVIVSGAIVGGSGYSFGSDGGTNISTYNGTNSTILTRGYTPSPAAAITVTPSWTTASLSALATISVGGTVTAVVHSEERYYVADFTSGANAGLTHTPSGVSGVLTPVAGLFLVPMLTTSQQTFTVTSTDGAISTTTTLTIPPVIDDGVVEVVWNGTAWQ